MLLVYLDFDRSQSFRLSGFWLYSLHCGDPPDCLRPARVLKYVTRWDHDLPVLAGDVRKDRIGILAK